MKYRDDDVYKMLEEIIVNAGVEIMYMNIPAEDAGRSDTEGLIIQMPDKDIFESEMQAALVLGHEMGHILIGDRKEYDLRDHVEIESTCDLIGAYLYKLAEMSAGTRLERSVFKDMLKKD